MGLLLSVLVQCVGVLEVIACYHHFTYGLTPYECTPELTDIKDTYVREISETEDTNYETNYYENTELVSITKHTTGIQSVPIIEEEKSGQFAPDVSKDLIKQYKKKVLRIDSKQEEDLEIQGNDDVERTRSVSPVKEIQVKKIEEHKVVTKPEVKKEVSIDEDVSYYQNVEGLQQITGRLLISAPKKIFEDKEVEKHLIRQERELSENGCIKTGAVPKITKSSLEVTPLKSECNSTKTDCCQKIDGNCCVVQSVTSDVRSYSQIENVKPNVSKDSEFFKNGSFDEISKVSSDQLSDTIFSKQNVETDIVSSFSNATEKSEVCSEQPNSDTTDYFKQTENLSKISSDQPTSDTTSYFKQTETDIVGSFGDETEILKTKSEQPTSDTSYFKQTETDVVSSFGDETSTGISDHPTSDTTYYQQTESGIASSFRIDTQDSKQQSESTIGTTGNDINTESAFESRNRFLESEPSETETTYPLTETSDLITESDITPGQDVLDDSAVPDLITTATTEEDISNIEEISRPEMTEEEHLNRVYNHSGRYFQIDAEPVSDVEAEYFLQNPQLAELLQNHGAEVNGFTGHEDDSISSGPAAEFLVEFIPPPEGFPPDQEMEYVIEVVPPMGGGMFPYEEGMGPMMFHHGPGGMSQIIFEEGHEGMGPLMFQEGPEGMGPLMFQEGPEGMGPLMFQEGPEGMGPLMFQEGPEGMGPLMFQEGPGGMGPMLFQEGPGGIGSMMFQEGPEGIIYHHEGMIPNELNIPGSVFFRPPSPFPEARSASRNETESNISSEAAPQPDGSVVNEQITAVDTTNIPKEELAEPKPESRVSEEVSEDKNTASEGKAEVEVERQEDSESKRDESVSSHKVTVKHPQEESFSVQKPDSASPQETSGSKTNNGGHTVTVKHSQEESFQIRSSAPLEESKETVTETIIESGEKNESPSRNNHKITVMHKQEDRLRSEAIESPKPTEVPSESTVESAPLIEVQTPTIDDLSKKETTFLEQKPDVKEYHYLIKEEEIETVIEMKIEDDKATGSSSNTQKEESKIESARTVDDIKKTILPDIEEDANVQDWVNKCESKEPEDQNIQNLMKELEVLKSTKESSFKKVVSELELNKPDTDVSKSISKDEEVIDTKIKTSKSQEDAKTKNATESKLSKSCSDTSELIFAPIDPKSGDKPTLPEIRRYDSEPIFHDNNNEEDEPTTPYDEDFLRSLDGVKFKPLTRDDGSWRRKNFKKRRSSSNSSRGSSKSSRDDELKMLTSLEEIEQGVKYDDLSFKDKQNKDHHIPETKISEKSDVEIIKDDTAVISRKTLKTEESAKKQIEIKPKEDAKKQIETEELTGARKKTNLAEILERKEESETKPKRSLQENVHVSSDEYFTDEESLEKLRIEKAHESYETRKNLRSISKIASFEEATNSQHEELLQPRLSQDRRSSQESDTTATYCTGEESNTSDVETLDRTASPRGGTTSGRVINRARSDPSEAFWVNQ